MYINVNDSNVRRTSFGYKCPECNFKYYAKNILTKQGQCAYSEYITAVDHFSKKRFDATEIVRKYLPFIKEHKNLDLLTPIGQEFEIPKIKTQMGVIKEIPKEQSFIDKLLNRKIKTEQIVETEEIETDAYDFKNINAELFCLNGGLKNNVYIHTEETRRRSHCRLEFESYLMDNDNFTPLYSVPVYGEDGTYPLPYRRFSTTEGIKQMENLIDEYLKTKITSRFEETIKAYLEGEQREKQKLINDALDAEIEENLSRIQW